MTASDNKPFHIKELFTPGVIVASLGYFVDIFDLLLFSIVRKPSLASLGLDANEQIQTGLMLHNLQMIGMLIGGVVWGVWGDKRGRLQVLFGSILLYSVANLANAFVQSVESYAFWRFIAGLGLAGELGAGITLVAETLPKAYRGYGTMVVASVGVSGAVFAGLVGELFDWRTTYAIGGVLGLLLLFLRINTAESLLFKEKAHSNAITRGSFLSLFKKKDRAFRFFGCILMGVPIWYVIGTLIQLSPEFATALGITGEITAGRAVMVSYGGLVLGDFLSGWISQKLRSRLRAVLIFLVGLCLTVAAYFTTTQGESSAYFYFICGMLGFFAGYWAVFVTMAAEQFGTNLRATVATSAPNFVRASVVPMSLTFTALKDGMGILGAAQVVGTVVLMIALAATLSLKDTFHRDLAYFEVD